MALGVSNEENPEIVLDFEAIPITSLLSMTALGDAFGSRHRCPSEKTFLGARIEIYWKCSVSGAWN
jgi:hypothetical protein